MSLAIRIKTPPIGITTASIARPEQAAPLVNSNSPIHTPDTEHYTSPHYGPCNSNSDSGSEHSTPPPPVPPPFIPTPRTPSTSQGTQQPPILSNIQLPGRSFSPLPETTDNGFNFYYTAVGFLACAGNVILNVNTETGKLKIGNVEQIKTQKEPPPKHTDRFLVTITPSTITLQPLDGTSDILSIHKDADNNVTVLFIKQTPEKQPSTIISDKNISDLNTNCHVEKIVTIDNDGKS